MHANPLKTLGTFGQSLWLDYIRRDLITSGQLRRLIEEDGLQGMTSNPSIFEKAIVDCHKYHECLGIARRLEEAQAIVNDALAIGASPGDGLRKEHDRSE